MTSRVAGVVEEVGSAICAGRLSAGEPLTAERLQAQTGTSRSGVREALGVLVSLGLLRVRRRIGYEVCGPEEWQLLAPEVMRWRLAGPDAAAVTAELTALRAVIEPAAAADAALGASDTDRAGLVDAASELWASAVNGDREAFVAADVRLHATVLEASGNRLYQALGATLAAALPDRAPDAESISLDRAREHRDLADAIVARDAPAAASIARRIAEAHAV